MNNTFKRICIFCVSLPSFFCMVWFADSHHHWMVQIFVVLTTFISLCEIHKMLSMKLTLLPKEAMTIFPLLLPVATVLCAVLELNGDFEIYAFALIVVIEIFYALFCRNSERESAFETLFISATIGVFVVVYPGFFMCFISKIATLHHSREFLLVFLAIIFGSDSGAWLFGMLFGKNNRGFISVSPNKSVAGYVGGFLTAFLVVLACSRIFSDVFNLKLWQIFVVAVATALAGMIGDLFASLIKRYCGVKDSGNLIPGRGGMLDCIDSLSLSAPIYYFLVKFMLGI